VRNLAIFPTHYTFSPVVSEFPNSFSYPDFPEEKVAALDNWMVLFHISLVPKLSPTVDWKRESVRHVAMQSIHLVSPRCRYRQ